MSLDALVVSCSYQHSFFILEKKDGTLELIALLEEILNNTLNFVRVITQLINRFFKLFYI